MASFKKAPKEPGKKKRKRTYRSRSSLPVWGWGWAEQARRWELRAIRAKRGWNKACISVSTLPVLGTYWLACLACSVTAFHFPFLASRDRERSKLEKGRVDVRCSSSHEAKQWSGRPSSSRSRAFCLQGTSTAA